MRSSPSPPVAMPGAPRALPPVAGSFPRRVHRPWWRVAVPWTLWRYLLGEVTRVFLLGVIGVSLLYTVLAAYQTVRSGLQLSFIWPLMAKTFAYPLYYSLPLALLFAVTLVIGRMVNDLEVAAMRCHGVSNLQVYVPILALGAALAAASFYLNGWIVPGIHYEKRNLQAYILDQLRSLGTGANRTLLLPDDAGTLWVGAYQGMDLWRVDIDLELRGRSQVLPQLKEHLPEGMPVRVKILARQGKLELIPERMAVILNLRGVDVLVPEPVRDAAVANERFHQTITISDNVIIPLSFAPKSPGTKDRVHPDLVAYIEELRAERRRLSLLERENLELAAHRPEAAEEAGESSSVTKARRHAERKIASARTELHRRFAFSFACLTFPLVGVSLTFLLQRWSRLVPFFLANLIVIAGFYPLLMVGVFLGESGVFPPLSLALPNLALLAAGVALARKVERQ